MLIHNPSGHYHFLQGIDPYSCGVIADDGFEIVRITLTQPLPWRAGLDSIAMYLEHSGATKSALCGVELRCATPYSMEGFVGFNRAYCHVLQDWGLYVDDYNPIARTNVAPQNIPTDMPQQIFAFSYTSKADSNSMAGTFVVAGAGELVEGKLDVAGIIRRGETGEKALLEKAEHVMGSMNERIRGLGADPASISQVNVYTIHPVDRIVRQVVLRDLPLSTYGGIHWYPSHPPVEAIEFEMDLRGIGRETRMLL